MRHLVLVSAVLVLLARLASAGDDPGAGGSAGQPARPVAAPASSRASVAPARAETEPQGAGADAPEATEEDPAPTVEFAVSTTNRYLYHGLLIEEEGALVQASIDVHVPLLVGTGFLKTVDLGAMLWTSFGTGPSGSGGDHEDPRPFSEADATLSLTAELAGGWSLGASFMWYRYPNGNTTPAEEVSATLGYDDGPLWPEGGRFRGLSPTATVAYEVRGQSDDGQRLGLYLGVGIAPRLSLTADPEGASLAFPVAAGFSLSNYYEDADGNDETFGYVELGPELELPLGGREGGSSFSLTFGVHVLLAGEHVRIYNDTDEPELVGFVTFRTSF